MGNNRSFLKVNAKLCTFCNRCSLTCAYNRYQVADVGFSAVRLEHDLPDSFKVKVKVCLQCEDADCIKACPSGALARDEQGIVVLDKERCDSCNGEFKCVEACKFGFIYQNPGLDYPIKCDLCGGDPLCVKQCPVSIIKMEIR